MKRTWSINGRFLTQPVTGVQRYAHEIVLALDQLLIKRHPLARDLQLELLAPAGISHAPQLRAIRLRTFGSMPGHLWEQIVMPTVARHGLLSLCNTGPLATTKHIVCIHDAIPRTYPQSYTFGFRAFYRILQPVLGCTAIAVTTVSEYSAATLSRYRIAARHKIQIAPNGYEHVLRWQPKHSPETRAAAGARTVVVIGGLAQHKNIGLLVKLAARLKAVGIRIAVTGLSDSPVFNAAKFGCEADDVIWLGRLPDDSLAALLQDSLCLAFPSLTEGFGLPPLEAMALGCPVIVSDAASLPEVCGNAALYAPPTNPEPWYDQILRLHRDIALRNELSRRGRARAKRFSWDTSALLYLKLMARADGMDVEKDRSFPPSTKF